MDLLLNSHMYGHMVPYPCRLLQMNSNYASILSVQLRLSNIGFWLAELPFWNTAQMQQTKNIQPTEGRPAVYPQFTAKKWYFPASVLTPRLLLWRVELGIRLATLSQVLLIMHYTQHPRGHLKGCLICVFRSLPLGIFKKDRNNWNKRRSQQNKSCKRKKNIISMSSLFFFKGLSRWQDCMILQSFICRVLQLLIWRQSRCAPQMDGFFQVFFQSQPVKPCKQILLPFSIVTQTQKRDAQALTLFLA